MANVLSNTFRVVVEGARQSLQAELLAGMTFARAARTALDPQVSSRNLQNARRAYETFLARRHEVPLGPDAEAELDAGLARLRAELEALEHRFA